MSLSRSAELYLAVLCRVWRCGRREGVERALELAAAVRAADPPRARPGTAVLVFVGDVGGHAAWLPAGDAVRVGDAWLVDLALGDVRVTVRVPEDLGAALAARGRPFARATTGGGMQGVDTTLPESRAPPGTGQ